MIFDSDCYSMYTPTHCHYPWASAAVPANVAKCATLYVVLVSTLELTCWRGTRKSFIRYHWQMQI